MESEMKASDFLSTYSKRSQASWEAAALDLATRGDFIHFPFVSVLLRSPDGQLTGAINVSSDYFTVGEHGDTLHLPLTPITAQKIADLNGWMLPTRKIVNAIWDAANVKLQATPMREAWIRRGLNPDAMMISLQGFGEHEDVIRSQLGGREGLVSGHKKDVVISNAMKPGKVAIYGWHDLSGANTGGQQGKPIQGLNPSSHSSSYVDYSHSIRFIEPFVTMDGVKIPITDPSVASLVSDEGPLRFTRYETGTPAPSTPLNGGGSGPVAALTPSTTSSKTTAALGLVVLSSLGQCSMGAAIFQDGALRINNAVIFQGK
jgi:hypothetical protein